MGWKTVLLFSLLLPPFFPSATPTLTCKCQEQKDSRSGLGEDQDHDHGNVQEPDFDSFGTPQFDHEDRDRGHSREILVLGEMTQGFMGPRRRRSVPRFQQNHPKLTSFQNSESRKKSRDSQIHIFTATDQRDISRSSPEVNRSGSPVNLVEDPQANALSSAWNSYGPNARPIPHHPQFPSRRNGEWIQFQPMDSEWSSRIGQPAKPPEPTLFTQFLARYIDFELTHYEWTEFARQSALVGFFLLVGIGWILLGISINIIPLSLHSASRRNLVEEGDEEGSIWGNSIIKTITETVHLALEGDWLAKLEEKVTGGGGGGGWLSTSVSCCILPNEKTLGEAECQVIRKGRKLSTFKCLSDLIYNFNFGPSNH